jgi:hypothetical protein
MDLRQSGLCGLDKEPNDLAVIADGPLDTSVLQQKVVTMNLWGMLGAIVIAVLLTLPEVARGEDDRCAQVRAGVAKYGQAVAIRWARANGYSAAQIKQARKCLIRRGSL